MEQWKKLLASLTLRQRYAIAAAAIVVFGGLLAFSRWRHEQDFRPLLTGVAAEDASGVVQKLKESGVEYRLSEDGRSILVPSARLPELRLQMAAAGMPKTGRIGFELFDRTNLGSTDFAEHINYGRALEGELERSIRSITEVEQARVHITFPKDSIFVESRMPAKASVLLHTKPGGKVSSQNVLAICHLVASAVEGLAPEAVSVLDMRGTLLSRPRRAGSAHEASDESLEYRQKLERDVLAKLHSTLEPLLGADKFRASVSIDCDLTSGEESQETYDPERTIMLSTQKSEEGTTALSSSGVPGTASNMPRPTSSPAAGRSGISRRTENVSYQPSKTVRHVRTPQGIVKRVSVALLIDHAVRWETQNNRQVRKLVPQSPETLKTIRDVTTAVAGLNMERGDQLVVESLAFESTVGTDPMQSPGNPSSPVQPQSLQIPLDFRDQRVLIGAGAALAVLLAAIVFLWLRRKKKKAKAQATMAPQLESGTQQNALPDGDALHMKQQLTDQADQKRQALVEAQNRLKLKPVQTPKGEVLVEYLRESVKADPAHAASVIRSWLHEE